MQAPQWPSSQAIFVPVRPRSSRRRVGQRRARPAASTSWSAAPLTREAQAPVVTARMSARWTSRNVARLTMRRSPSSLDLRQRAPELAGGFEQLADLVALLLVAVRARRSRVQREPEHADRVGLARPEQRRRHREVLVDARERHRLRERLLPVGALRLERRLAVGDPVRVAGEHARSRVLVEPGDARGAQRDQQRARLLPVGVVRGVDDLLRRDEAVEARAGRSGSRPRCRRRRPRLPANSAASARQVGDAGVGDDQLRAGIPVDEAARGGRRSAAARGRRGSGSARRARRPARTPARAARRSAGTSARAGGA